MNKFTPGPWLISSDDETTIYHENKQFEDEPCICIASENPCAAFVNSEKWQKANARLISKAPDMYELLKRVLVTRGAVTRGETEMVILNNIKKILDEIE